MKKYTHKGFIFIVMLAFLILSCEDFLEIETPRNRMVSEEVFSSEETALSAIQGIYNELFVSAFSSGGRNSVTFLTGLSSDNLEGLSSSNIPRVQLDEHEITADNELILYLWTSAYNTIYMCNAFLDGIANSDELNMELRGQLQGEALFIRGFTYFYLVNLYGDVPLITSPNYSENAVSDRTNSEEVWKLIFEDLETSLNLLPESYRNNERTNLTKYAALTMLARASLYREDWKGVENYSTQVIESNRYDLLEDHNDVFLANSNEAIWQISPLGNGQQSSQTNEGGLLIIDPVLYFVAVARLNEDFYETFEKNDLRRQKWIGYNEAINVYFPYKYKVWTSNDLPPLEYSMVLRYAELYLMRAEAQTHLGNYTEALQDLNVIRERSELPSISTEDVVNQTEILNFIMEERRNEFFAEWGHRWFDMRRTNRLEEVFGERQTWQATDALYPIPNEERRKNLNLTQNPGY